MTDLEKTELTIAIPTNGRPHCLKVCLDSIMNNVTIPCKIAVLDSTPSNTNAHVFKMYDDLYYSYPVEVDKFDYNVPPGAARKLLAEKAKTKYILFLDDDLVVYKNTVENMKLYADKKNCEIISGVWIEKPHIRPIGYNYNFGASEKGPFVLKCPIYWKDMPESCILPLHDVMASIFAKRQVFNKVSFDERYEFYYELFDFFFQCYTKNVVVTVHGGSRFFHNPLKYKSKSTRQTQNPEMDKDRFREKWNYEPILARGRDIGIKGYVQRGFSRLSRIL